MTAIGPAPIPTRPAEYLPPIMDATSDEDAAQEKELSKKLRELKEIILNKSATELKTFFKVGDNLKLVKDKLDFSNLSATHYAARRGNLDIIKLLAQKDFNWNLKQPSSGKTALHVAVEQGNPKVVKYLIGRHEVDVKLGAYFEIPRSDGSSRCSGNTIMHIAVVLNVKDSVLLKEIIKLRKCTDLFQIRNQMDLTPLELAMRMENKLTFDLFLKNAGEKCIPTSFNKIGDPISHWAFKSLGLEFLKSIGILSLRKEEVILLNRHGQTLLNSLILLGKQDVINYIISGLDRKLRFKFVNTPNAKGVTGLVLAVSKEDKNVVDLLIKYNADINAKVSSEDFGMNALMVACKLNDGSAIVEELVNKGADVNAVNTLGETPLHIVAASSAFKEAAVLKKAQAIVNSGKVDLEKATYGKKYTPIFSAAVHGHFTLFIYLSKWADIEHCNANGQTILHVVVMKSELLLCRINNEKNRMNIGKQDYLYSQTILHIAARNFCTERQMDVFKILVGHGRLPVSENRDDLDTQDVYGQTALHKATVARNREAVDILISAGAAISIKDNVGQTILHLAVLANDAALFQFLLDKKCSIVRTNKLNQTVLHLAAIVGNPSIVKKILEHRDAKSLISKCDLNGRTALHYAVEAAGASKDIVKMLRSKTDDSVVDQFGYTVLDIAKRNPNVEIFQLFRETKTDIEHSFRSAIQLDKSDMIKSGVEELLTTGQPFHSTYKIEGKLDSNKKPDHEDSAFVKFTNTTNTNDQVLYEEIMKETSVDGLSPLHQAAMDGRQDVVKALLSPLEAKHSNSIKTFLSLADLSGNTPVHWAILNYPVDRKSSNTDFNALKDYFIHVGCDFNIPNNRNQTVMHIAAALGRRGLFCELLKHGGNPNLPDSDGFNCLHIACRGGHVMIVEELIRQGVNVNAFTYENNSPLHICALYNSSEAAKCLLNAGADPTCVNNAEQTPEQIAIELSHTNFIRVIWQLNADLKGYLGPESSVTSRFVYQGQIKHDNIKEKFPEIVADYPKLAETLLDFYLIPLAKSQKHTDEMSVAIDLELFNTEKVERNPLISMVFNERSNLLNHPVTKTYLHHKWDQVASYFYYFMALVYLGAASCFTAYVIQMKEDYRQGVSGNSPNTQQQGAEKYYPKGFRAYTFAATLCLCVIPLIVEILVMLLMRTLYLTKTKISNQFQLIYFSSVTAFLIVEYFLIIHFYKVKFEDYIPNEAGWFRNTLVLFTLWTIVGFHVRQSQHFGIYVVIMGKIIATFLKLVIPLSFFVIAPALCFYILNPLGSEMFETPEITVYRALYMTVGNYDGDEYKNSLGGWLAGLQGFIAIFCLFIVTVVIMNLITAVAIGDVEAAEANAIETKLELAANLIIQTEFIRRKAFKQGSQKFERNPQIWDLKDHQPFGLTSILQMLWGKAAISKSAILDQIKSYYLSKYDLNLVDAKEDEIIPTTETPFKPTAAPSTQANTRKEFRGHEGLDSLFDRLGEFTNQLNHQGSQNNQNIGDVEGISLRAPSLRRQIKNTFQPTNVSNTFETFANSYRTETKTTTTTTSRVFKNF